MTPPVGQNSMAKWLLPLLFFFYTPLAQAYGDEAPRPKPPEVRKNNELSIGIPAPVAGMHPYLDRGAASRYAQGLVLRPIMAFDANWQLVCMLCAVLPSNESGTIRQEFYDGSKQGVAITITLKPGLRWGDGRPLTAEDAAFTASLTEHLPPSLAGLRKVSVDSPQQFTLHFRDLSVELTALTDFYPLPKALEQAAVGADYAKNSRYRRTPFDPGLYNGAYILSDSWNGGWLFTANASFSGAKPQLQTVRLQRAPSVAAALNSYDRGAYTMLAWDLIATTEETARYSEQNVGRFNAVVRPSALFEHIALNLENPLLTDRRTRLALLLALDRAGMNQAAFRGNAVVAPAFISPLDRSFNNDLPIQTLNRERAKQLLSDAGFKPGADGVLVAPNGQRLTLTLLTTEGNASRAMLQQMVSNSWKQIGVEVQPKLVPATELLSTILPQRRFEGAVLFAIASFPDAAATSLLHSQSIPNQKNEFNGQNYSGYKNPTMDGLLENLDKTTSIAYRLQLRRAMQQIYSADLPSLPLFFRPARYLLPVGATGIPSTAHQFPATLWVEDWRFVITDDN